MPGSRPEILISPAGRLGVLRQLDRLLGRVVPGVRDHPALALGLRAHDLDGAFAGKPINSWKVFPLRPWLLLFSCIVMAVLYFGDEMFFKGNPLIIKQTVSAIALVTFLSSWGPPALFIVLTAIAAFGYLLRPMGLAVATLVLVIGSAYGGHEFKLKEASILGVVLAIFVVLVFIKGLGLSMNIWPDWI